jgi:hypothetical protein
VKTCRRVVPGEGEPIVAIGPEKEKLTVYKAESAVIEYLYTCQEEVRTWGSFRPPFQFDEGFGEALRGLG